MGRRCRRRREPNQPAIIAISFGLGMFVALFFSFRLALFLMICALIYIGFQYLSR